MSDYYSSYTTPEAVSRQLEKANPGASIASHASEYADYFAYMRDIIPQVSSVITDYCNRSFVPYTDTYTYAWQPNILQKHVSRNVLFLEHDLLVLSSITWFDDTTLSATDYVLMPENALPYSKIVFNPSSIAWSGYSEFTDVMQIAGTWGYVQNLTQAYTTMESIASTLSSSATTITVASADSYETLQYIKIDDELLQITNVNTTTEVLTVERGVNGTTAASHNNPYSIRRFNVDPSIRLAATRLVAMMYQRRNDSAGRAQYVDGASILEELPPLVLDTLKDRQRLILRAV